MGWVIVAAYAAVWLGYGFRLSLYMKDQDARDRELKALRAQARALNLPMPDERNSHDQH